MCCQDSESFEHAGRRIVNQKSGAALSRGDSIALPMDASARHLCRQRRPIFVRQQVERLDHFGMRCLRLHLGKGIARALSEAWLSATLGFNL